MIPEDPLASMNLRTTVGDALVDPSSSTGWVEQPGVGPRQRN